jgi:hypothetical protein
MPLPPFPEAVDDLIEAKPPLISMPWPPFPEAFDDWILADTPPTMMPSPPFPETVDELIKDEAEAQQIKMPARTLPEATTFETVTVFALLPASTPS